MRPRSVRLIPVSVAFALMLAGCAPAEPSGAPAVTLPPSDRTAVTLGIYSGVPDPSWTLDDGSAAELRRLIAALPTAFGTPSSGGLGYHGFTITLTGAGRDDRTLVAYQGAIADAGDEARRYWQDPEGTVERYLLAAGEPFLKAGEVQVVTDALDQFYGRPAGHRDARDSTGSRASARRGEPLASSRRQPARRL